MDLEKLDQNDRMITFASGALVIAGIVAAGWYGLYSLTWLAVLSALAALFVVFQPQLATGVTLPGSKGSLLLLFGGIAGVVMVLALLTTISLVFVAFGLPDIMFLIAVAAGIALAWFAWQGFQAEGGRFQIGAASPAAQPTTPSVAEPEPVASSDPEA